MPSNTPLIAQEEEVCRGRAHTLSDRRTTGPRQEPSHFHTNLVFCTGGGGLAPADQSEVSAQVGGIPSGSQQSAAKWNIHAGAAVGSFQGRETVSSAWLEVIPAGKLLPVWVLMKKEPWNKKVKPGYLKKSTKKNHLHSTETKGHVDPQVPQSNRYTEKFPLWHARGVSCTATGAAAAAPTPGWFILHIGSSPRTCGRRRFRGSQMKKPNESQSRKCSCAVRRAWRLL